MKALNNFIIEKLKINKDSCSEIADINTSVACITQILNINLGHSGYKSIVNKIEEWCKDNLIKDFVKKVTCIVPKRALKKRYPNYYINLEQTGWLDKIEEPSSATMNLINFLINHFKEIESYKDKKLYIVNEGRTLIYTIEEDIYFCFMVKW